MHFLHLEDRGACDCDLESSSTLQLPRKWVSECLYPCQYEGQGYVKLGAR